MSSGKVSFSFSYDFNAFLHNKSDSCSQPGDPDEVQRAAFVHIRQKIRLILFLRAASSAAPFQWLKLNAFANIKASGSRGAAQ